MGDSDHVYMAGLPSTCTAVAITTLFGLLDMEVLWCKVLADTYNTGACTALVQLSSMENACLAIASFDGKRFDDAMKDDAPVAFAAEKWPELAGTAEANRGDALSPAQQLLASWRSSKGSEGKGGRPTGRSIPLAFKGPGM